MNKAPLRKRVSILLNRLYLYPAPEPLPRTRLYWLAFGLVTLATLLYSAFYLYYYANLHAAYLTHGEDLGIYDQAIWSLWHGQLFHQTICNTISDTNCYGLNGIPRFAIHFEPTLFLISLLYLIWPNPVALLTLQTLVVAAGAFPAFWLARLRLRNELAGVAIAVLYLLYPAQLDATNWEFHVVTLTAALLLFTLYFMYTRRTIWLFVFALLALGCKEEIAGLVVLLGLWSIIFQRRWRTGLALIAISLVWVGVALWMYRHFSPTGHPLLASRYSYLGSSPVKIVLNLLLHPRTTLKTFVLERNHFLYLRTLLSPAGYLPILAPWVLLIAAPTIALNLLSNNAQMYSGMFQYNAEIVPVLVFATIEAVVLILWLFQRLTSYIRSRRRMVEPGNRNTHLNMPGRIAYIGHLSLLALVLCYIVASTVRYDYLRENTPFSRSFAWPQPNAHTELAQQFIAMVPSNASVSAQSTLVPHLSQRTRIYQFPYADDRADYIFLDVTSNTIYPFYNSPDYIREVKRVLLDGHYGIAVARDGYLLLKRGLPAPTVSPSSLAGVKSAGDERFVLPTLPDSFCSFTQSSPSEVQNPVQVTIADNPSSTTTAADLVGYRVDANNPFSISSDQMTVTTYWRVVAPTKVPVQPTVFITDGHGQEYLANFDFPSVYWCQTNAWKPGTIVKLQSRTFSLEQYFAMPRGIVHVSIALVPLTQVFDTMMQVQHRLPLHVVEGNGKVSATSSSNGVQLTRLRLIQ